MASQQNDSTMGDFGDAVVEASSRLPPEPMPDVYHTMCEIILDGFHDSFVLNPQTTLWTYFGQRLKQPRAHQVAHATRQLLSCRAFVAHAVDADRRIRPVLVAGAMLQAPEQEAYLFILNNSLYPAHIVYEVSEFALDSVMLTNAQGTSVSIMERVVSFLKTEQARGVKGLTERMAMVEAALNSPPVRNAMGVVIIDHILAQPRLDMVFATPAKPKEGTVSLSSALGSVAGLGGKK